MRSDDLDLRQTFLGEVQLYTPVLTREKFAELVGLEPGVVSAACDRGYWPTVKVGKRSLVNLEAIRAAAAVKGRDFTL